MVIDIGVHLDLPLPYGSRWTFEKACQVLRERGRAEPSRVHAEVVRYFGWPAQAIAYKLGERAWLAAGRKPRGALDSTWNAGTRPHSASARSAWTVSLASCALSLARAR